MGNSEDIINMVNQSGYLFQIRVEDEIKQSRPFHGWTSIGQEYGWSNDETGSEGFVDIVLKHQGNLRLIIECKRAREGKWIFLLPKEKQEDNIIRLCWGALTTDKHLIHAWDEFRFGPACYEVNYCVIRGQGENDKPMLERIASVLLDATESLLQRELWIFKKSNKQGPVTYIPTIITNSTLYCCRFSAENIDLSSGSLAIDDADLFEVPFVHFRKSLTNQYLDYSNEKSIEDLNKATERSVFIIQANSIVKFLNNGDLNRVDNFDSYPWVGIS